MSPISCFFLSITRYDSYTWHCIVGVAYPVGRHYLLDRYNDRLILCFFFGFEYIVIGFFFLSLFIFLKDILSYTITDLYILQRLLLCMTGNLHKVQ